MTLLLVLLGAGVGAPSRWLLDQYVQSRRDSPFPWGTLSINVSGSLLLGLLVGSAAFGTGSTALLALLGTGFCGGFTTFSTFAFETARLAEEGSYLEAGLNITGSVALGLLAAVLGWYAGHAVWA